MKRSKIIVFDKRNLIRQAIITILKQIKNLKIIAEVDNFDQCIKLCRKIKPEIVLIGEIETLLSTANISYQIKQISSETKVLILTDELKKKEVLDDFISGADGYISNNWTLNELKKAFYDSPNY